MRRAPALFVPVLLVAAWLSPAPASAKPKPAPPLAGLDAYVERAMREFGVPGMAVAVVKDGQVVLAKGYGVRRAGEPAPVDADTLFGIASNTKAFTCAGAVDPRRGGEAGLGRPASRRTCPRSRCTTRG